MYKHFKIHQHEGITSVVFNSEGKSVNTFNAETIAELDAVTKELAANPGKGVIFSSGKNSFVVGADIAEFVKLFPEPLSKVEEVVKIGQKIFNRIEDLPVPTVAVLNGNALGGGFELALACDYRVAMDVSAQIGLPEVKLGLIPAWGGTTRLPRMIGTDNAIELICSGKTVSPKDALKYKMVDVVIAPEHAHQAAINFINLGENYKKIRQLKTGPIKMGWVEWMMSFRLAEGQVSAKAGKHYPAPVKALNVMKDGKKLNRDEALVYEVGAFVELFSGQTAKNLINVFLAEQAVKGSNRKFTDKNNIKSIGVIGTGVMGRGIAAHTAGKKIKVKIFDKSPELLEKCIKEAKDYQMTKVGKGYITTDEAINVISNIVPVKNISDMFDCDLIIEAIYENFDAKIEIFKQLEGYKGVFATNTSSLSIDKLNDKIGNNSNFCGLHFFNPVNKMPLVEVVKGKYTSDESVARAVNYVSTIGKTPIVVKDCNGFLVNRLLFPYFAAFDSLVADGIDFQQIDKAMEDWGWPMGPAHLSDLVGIDILYHAADAMKKAYPGRCNFDMNNGPTAQLASMKCYGQKSFKGWYNWISKGEGYKKNGPNWKSGRSLLADEIVAFLMKPMVDEAKLILEEGIVSSWNDINIGMIFGAGFPPFLGGLDKI